MKPRDAKASLPKEMPSQQSRSRQRRGKQQPHPDVDAAGSGGGCLKGEAMRAEWRRDPAAGKSPMARSEADGADADADARKGGRIGGHRIEEPDLKRRWGSVASFG